MGWHLAGYKLEHGLERHPPKVTSEGHSISLRGAQSAAARFGVQCIDSMTLDVWRSETDSRTLRIFDVRTKEEFELAHIADSTHAPGGQLVQATDTFIATQNARVVLVDDWLVRSLMTATWLVQLGWCEVYVLESGLRNQPISSGKQIKISYGLEKRLVKMISAKAAHAAQADGATLIDISRSLLYREKHAKGAFWGSRSKLSDDLTKAKISGQIVFIAADTDLAVLAALDFKNNDKDVSVVDGGTEAWEKDGLPMEAGMNNLLSAPTDVYLRAYDRQDPQEIEQAMNDYLTWEIGLVEQIARPGGISFKVYPSV
tara:strand:- start:1464 stop:2408 length:945 start_codon:yes stop_codon:yes gene_type:complete